MTSICRGAGECLIQSVDENTYEKSPDYTCTYNCSPVPCCNAIVCGTQLPLWFHGLKHEGICICPNCDAMFGKKLDVVENADCPVCLQTTVSIVMPNCTHSVCAVCFKRRIYGSPDSPEPVFPYSDEVENEWYTDQNDINFLARYPLVIDYSRDWIRWDRQREEKYADEESLRVCPVCCR